MIGVLLPRCQTNFEGMEAQRKSSELCAKGSVGDVFWLCFQRPTDHTLSIDPATYSFQTHSA